jgi:hypothetical protein
MEFQFQPNGSDCRLKIPSGFSRWSFSFNLTDRNVGSRYHPALADGVSVSTEQTEPRAKISAITAGVVRLKLKLHQLKPDGISWG